jgi:hypothetical protein
MIRFLQNINKKIIQQKKKKFLCGLFGDQVSYEEGKSTEGLAIPSPYTLMFGTIYFM